MCSILKRFVEAKAGYYSWLGAMVLMLVVSLQAIHLRTQRDTARADVVTLNQQLATEHAVSEGLAQVAKDTANAASTRASETLVQKNREITAQNSSLKKEIKDAYKDAKRPTGAGAGNADTYGDGGNTDCFNTQFGRLWNTANELRDSETAAP